MRTIEAVPTLLDHAAKTIDSDHWGQALEARAVDRPGSIYYPNRHYSTAAKQLLAEIIQQDSEGEFRHFEDETRHFYQELYPVGTVIHYTAEHLKKRFLANFPKLAAISLAPEYDLNESAPFTRVEGAEASGSVIIPTTFTFKRDYKLGGKLVESDVYSYQDWYGIILPTSDGKSLFSVKSGQEGESLVSLRFPLNDPAIIGSYPTISRRVTYENEVEHLYESIRRVQVCQPGAEWESALQSAKTSWSKVFSRIINKA